MLEQPKNLLDRDSFREGVLARDNNKCVICKKPAQDAHHIIERRLFDNGGYFLDNGASLCGECHIAAEMTTLSCEAIREAAGIQKIVLPSHFYEDETYDKWGNIILGSRRLKGELFEDPSVQKILQAGGVLSLFTKYVKYPRTYHLPWSPGLTSDDRMMESIERLQGREVVVSLKMDGENTTLYNDYIHARSLDSRSDITRHWVKNLHAQISHEIPDGWRLSVENLFAKHTIKYSNLKTFAYLFAIWNDKNQCLSWDETQEWAELLGLQLIPTLYRGIFDENLLKEKVYQPMYDGNEMEGYVVRVSDSFHYKDFRHYVGKYVTRSFKDRVANAHGHWRHQAIERNSLIRG